MVSEASELVKEAFVHCTFKLSRAAVRDGSRSQTAHPKSLLTAGTMTRAAPWQGPCSMPKNCRGLCAEGYREASSQGQVGTSELSTSSQACSQAT